MASDDDDADVAVDACGVERVEEGFLQRERPRVQLMRTVKDELCDPRLAVVDDEFIRVHPTTVAPEST